MANMTFKANLLPSSDLGYSLGSSTQQWKINGSSLGTAAFKNESGIWTISISGSSASCTGNAATATALTSSAGSSTVPIYFSGGKPVQCSTTLGVSITGNATNVTGTIAIANGGTGASSANNAIKNLALGVNVADGDFTDSTVMITNNNSGSTDTWFRRSSVSLWNYIKGKVTVDEVNAWITKLPQWGAAPVDTCFFIRQDTGGTNTYGRVPFSAMSSYVQSKCLPLSGGTMSGHIYLGGANAGSSTASTSQVVFGTSSDNHVVLSSNRHCLIINPSTNSTTNQIDLYLDQASVFPKGVKGAVWNDYAEYREADIIEPGRCVVENGDGTMKKSLKRMQPGAQIISDTFGFSIGETNKCKSPIAVAGRVLAYPYEDREIFKKYIGYPVCSGPNGTVSIMTDEEYRQKGYCAIGTISEIPNYDIWGENNTKVNGRIWIYIK